jgi:hypothetical protein
VVEVGLGCYVVTLRDHESRLQCSVEADCWSDVPSQLEGLLGRGQLPWKPFRSFRKKERPPDEGK